MRFRPTYFIVLVSSATLAGAASCNSILGNGDREADLGTGGSGVASSTTTGSGTMTTSGTMTSASASTGGAGGASTSTSSGPSSSGSGGGVGGAPTSASASTSTSASASAGTGGAAPCVDTSTDKLNCGVCGHSCLGASCKAGLCTPDLYAVATDPIPLVVSGGNVFWGSYTAGGVFRCSEDPTTCAGFPTAIVGSDGNLTAMTTDGTSLVWSDAGGVRSCALSGSCTAPVSEYPAGGMTDLASDGTTIWGTGQFAGVLYFPNNVLTASPPAFSVGGSPVYMALDAAGGRLAVAVKTSVFLCESLPACATKTKALSTTQTNAMDVAFDATTVYWTDAASSGATSDGAVRSCLATGCATPTDVATGQSSPVTLAIDSGFVYWTNAGTSATNFTDGALLKCPTSGCVGAPTVLAGKQKWPTWLRIVGSYVYWSSRGTGPGFTDGSVQRVAK